MRASSASSSTARAAIRGDIATCASSPERATASSRIRKTGAHCAMAASDKQATVTVDASNIDGSESSARSEQEWKRCRCYDLAAAPNMSNEKAMEERNGRYKRIRRLRQRTGVPSVENIYRKTIVTTLDSTAEEEDDDHYHIDGGILAHDPFEDSVHAIVHRPLAKIFLGRTTNGEPPYAPLHRGDAVSYQESIEPRTRFLPQRTTVSQALVDYVVHASSAKVAHTGEMVGTFDDSAAVAAAIVIEEYMRQLVEDALMENRPMLQTLTKESVQEFTTMMLTGFNWASHNDSDGSWDELVVAVNEELLSIQGGSGALEKDDVEIKAWIRDTVKHHYACLQAGSSQVDDDDHEVEEQHDPDESKPPTPHVRLSVRQSGMLGCPTYRISLKSELAGNHQVRVAVDGIENQEKAFKQLRKVKNVLQSQHERMSSRDASADSNSHVDKSIVELWKREREDEKMRKWEQEDEVLGKARSGIVDRRRARQQQVYAQTRKLKQENGQDSGREPKLEEDQVFIYKQVYIPPNGAPVIWVEGEIDSEGEKLRAERDRSRIAKLRVRAEGMERKIERMRIAAEKRRAAAEERKRIKALKKVRRQADALTDPAMKELFEDLNQQVHEPAAVSMGQADTSKDEASSDENEQQQQQEQSDSDQPTHQNASNGQSSGASQRRTHQSPDNAAPSSP
ncbi:hypothetical protein FI667_g14104, partial [Globisporangium splendens]